MRGAFDSPVGVYGGFYAIRRELFVPQPAGLILDDMFQPLSIIRQGYRSVLDSRACVFDTWPKKVEGEFHRKVRTLAGNFQLFQVAPWTLSFRIESCFNLFRIRSCGSSCLIFWWFCLSLPWSSRLGPFLCDLRGCSDSGLDCRDRRPAV